MPEGQEGQEGQPGVEGGGQGGEGGHGGVGKRGETGETGATGARGPQRRYGPLFGYLFATLVGVVVLYSLQFQVRDELLASCHRVNDLRTQFNERGPVINMLIKAERSELSRENLDPAVTLTHLPLRGVRVKEIPLTRCEEKFPKPFPF